MCLHPVEGYRVTHLQRSSQRRDKSLVALGHLKNHLVDCLGHTLGMLWLRDLETKKVQVAQ
jgi:hypothetical protein